MEGCKGKTLKEEDSNIRYQDWEEDNNIHYQDWEEDSKTLNAVATAVAEGNSEMLTWAAAGMGRGTLPEEGVSCMRFDQISTHLQMLG